MLPAALRTTPVVARMVVELTRAALFAGIEVPAHGRGAAMGDGPDGAPLRPVQRGPAAQKIRQKAAQHLDDGGAHASGQRPALTVDCRGGANGEARRRAAPPARGCPARCGGLDACRSWWC